MLKVIQYAPRVSESQLSDLMLLVMSSTWTDTRQVRRASAPQRSSFARLLHYHAGSSQRCETEIGSVDLDVCGFVSAASMGSTCLSG